MNYPIFSNIQDNYQQNTLKFYERINNNTEEPPRYVLSEETEQQMMVSCFSTVASVPVEENNIVPDVIEFWIYPGSGTSWMLIKYDQNKKSLVLVGWLDDIQITAYDLVLQKYSLHQYR